MILDHRQITPEALHALIEAFLLAQGVGMEEVDVPLSDLTAQVKHRLDSGSLVVVFDQESETPNILEREQAESVESAF